jgi:hypothetical protein
MVEDFPEGDDILSLRLIIARAANADSLGWWPDESLTAAAGFLWARLYPVAPDLAARACALRAAESRHNVLCPPPRLHLYRLDPMNRDRLKLRFASPAGATCPTAPITAWDGLRAHLLEAVGQPPAYRVVRRLQSGAIQLEIPEPPPGESPLWHRARTLAWAYLEGQGEGSVVFPYCEEEI